MYECLHVCMYPMCVTTACRGQKKVSDPLDVEFWIAGALCVCVVCVHTVLKVMMSAPPKAAFRRSILQVLDLIPSTTRKFWNIHCTFSPFSKETGLKNQKT